MNSQEVLLLKQTRVFSKSTEFAQKIYIFFSTIQRRNIRTFYTLLKDSSSWEFLLWRTARGAFKGRVGSSGLYLKDARQEGGL